MHIDQRLAERIGRLPQCSLKQNVYRLTGRSIDPIASSINGGRWAPRPNHEPGFPVLCTSLERHGALAEVVSYLTLLTPLPSKPLVMHELKVSTSKTISLAMGDLAEFGVDQSHYEERNYKQTQMIGAAINYMGLDGLISPSARWRCQNLTLFMDNHAMDEKLEVVASEDIEWHQWAINNGFVEKLEE